MTLVTLREAGTVASLITLATTGQTVETSTSTFTGALDGLTALSAKSLLVPFKAERSTLYHWSVLPAKSITMLSVTTRSIASIHAVRFSVVVVSIANSTSLSVVNCT